MIMKFRDRIWLVGERIRVKYAEDVYEIVETGRRLLLLCLTKRIRNREDTLNLSTINLASFSPYLHYLYKSI